MATGKEIRAKLKEEARKRARLRSMEERQAKKTAAPGSESYKPTKTDMGPNMSRVNKPERKKLIDKMPDKMVIPPKPEGNIASRVDNSDNTRIGPNMNQVNKPDAKPSTPEPKKDEDKMKWARGAMKSAQGLLQRPTTMKKGGKVKKMKKGGSVSSCSKRADGCIIKGKTKGRII